MKKRTEIECIARLNDLNGSIDDILNFLVGENLIKDAHAKSIKTSPELHKEMYYMLKKLQNDNKFQLLEYEWSILPVERIKLTVVTDNTQKEFTYNF